MCVWLSGCCRGCCRGCSIVEGRKEGRKGQAARLNKMLSSGLRMAARRSLVAGQRRGFRSSGVLRMADEAGAPAAAVTLNLSSPYGSAFADEPVALVNVPGMTGEYGIAPDMASTISELKPGQIEVFKNEGDEPEKYFVPAGFALTHADSRTDIACVDLISVDELDASLATSAYQEAKRTLDGLTEGTVEHAEAQIEVDVFEAACVAAGVSV